MHEIVPGIWTWRVHDATRGIDFNGWYVRSGGDAVVVDPPSAEERDLASIQEMRRPGMVLLTNKHHTRASLSFRERFDCPVHVPEKDAPLMEAAYQGTFRGGEVLSCGLLAVAVPDGKTPGETALLFPSGEGALIVGDAVLGKPGGSLSMLPAEKFKDPAAAKRGLRVLLEHRFDALLLGDGQPFPSGGRKALEAFLAS